MQERIVILLAAAACAHAASPVFAQEDQNESGLKESSSRPRSALKTRNESRFPLRRWAPSSRSGCRSQVQRILRKPFRVLPFTQWVATCRPTSLAPARL